MDRASDLIETTLECTLELVRYYSLDSVCIHQVQREREAGVALESTMKDPTDSRTYLTKASERPLEICSRYR